MTTATNLSECLLDEIAVTKRLNVSVFTVRRWRRVHQGPKYLKLGAAVRYSLADLQTWLESRRAGGEMKVDP